MPLSYLCPQAAETNPSFNRHNIADSQNTTDITSSISWQNTNTALHPKLIDNWPSTIMVPLSSLNTVWAQMQSTSRNDDIGPRTEVTDTNHARAVVKIWPTFSDLFNHPVKQKRTDLKV